MICLQLLFLTAGSLSLFYGAHGFHHFRHQQPQDPLYLNFCDDDVLEQDEPFGYIVPVEEIEFISDNGEKTSKPQKDLLIEQTVKFVKDKNDFSEAEPTTLRLKEIFTTSNTETWGAKAKTNEKVFFQTDLYGPDIDIQSPPKPPTPEPYPNSISDRFTKVYLKAITNLIQHILDAFFSTNLPAGPKPETELNNILDSKPLRQIKKRDISKRDTEDMVKIEGQSTTYNTKEITQTTEKGTSNSQQSISHITIKDSSLPENKVSRKDNEIVSATSSGSSKLKDTSEQPSTNEIDISASSSHSTKESEHPTTVTDKEAATNTYNIHTTMVLNDNKKEQMREVPHKDVIPIDDLINDEGTILHSLKITSKEIHDVNPLREYSNPNLVQHPLAGDNNKNPEESTSGVVMVVTGTILVVLILVSMGAAVVYAVQKKYLSRFQANQNSSNQRAAMA